VAEQRRTGRPRSRPPLGRLGQALFAYDIAATLLAVVVVLVLRLDTTNLMEAVVPFLPAAILPVFIRPLSYLAFGLYRREWRYASLHEVRDLIAAVVAGSLLFGAIYLVLAVVSAPGTNPFPRSFFILEPTFSLALAAGGRLLARTWLERRATDAGDGTTDARRIPTLVYGAGNAGAAIARLAASGGLPEIRVVGFLDDDRSKVRSRLLGHRVLGTVDDLSSAVQSTGAEQLLVAIPSIGAQGVRRALAAAQQERIQVTTVPSLRDIVTGRYQVSGVRRLSLEDLLRRPPVEIDAEAIASSLNGASVMVTGGGGSIGGELVRQILRLGPRVLTVVENHEWTLWTIERDIAALQKGSEGAHVVAALADVRSPAALDAVMRRARPDVVFHAAALKHVPYVELFPSEGVLTNVLGTRNLLRAAENSGAERFVLISTDKAVEPVSVMGATKRLAEHLTVIAGHRTGRAYAAVRFGNVLGSSGSIVPLLQRQLDDGLPLTITRPEATRYFMTISEAVSLILEAGADPRPGEVYVLDMGEPIRIIDLARDLVRLNGIDPDAVNLTITGLRPGERLHEKLFYDDETPERTQHPGILRATRSAESSVESEVEALVDELEIAARTHDDGAIRELLLQNRYQVRPEGVERPGAIETMGSIRIDS
jgi:FlaA1/EpsC-like NDP-sugar epimerase